MGIQIKKQKEKLKVRNERERVKNSIFRFNKQLGQHILNNPLVGQCIMDKACLVSTDTVLEVGPGTGNLTVKMLDIAKKVIVVEIDPRMVAEVSKRIETLGKTSKSEIIMGDVIKTELPYFDVCVSNTPYQISSPLVFKLLRLKRPPRVCILMFQREFAMRLVAKPGDNLYCRLSANVQMWANVKHIMKVGRNNFRPPPEVDSSVVRIEIKNPAPQINFDDWDGMLRICFLRKNRTISSCFKTKNVLKMLEKNYQTYLSVHGDDSNMVVDEVQDCKIRNEEISKILKKKVYDVLDQTGFAEKRSAKMSQIDFLKLLYAFHEAKIYFA